MAVPDDVSIRWASGDDEPLAAHVRESLGPGEITTGRLCPACGSDRHGAPWATHDGARVRVSLSRSGVHTLTAMSLDQPVGVDVEEVAAVAARWQPALVLAPGETALGPHAQAHAWAVKEAVLKALGTGLDRPMTEIVLTEHVTVDLHAPVGHIAVLATGPADRSGAATGRTGR